MGLESRLALQPLDLAHVPLSGRTLIEASAGTGKTWTIAALYVRLLLEAQLSVDRILVVTYTKAATAELHVRIRNRLLQLRDAMADPDAQRNEDDALLRYVLSRASDPQKDRARLAAAVEAFDLAPIHTIHGFCQRALGEHAFDAGLAFESEILGDDSALLRTVVEDCWRREMAQAHPLWAAWLLQKHCSPEQILRQLAPLRNKQGARKYLPGADADIETSYVHAYEAAHIAWARHAEEAFAQLEAWPHLDRRSYSARHLPNWRRALAACLERKEAHTQLADCLSRFTPAGLAEKAKNGEAFQHPLFEALGILHDTARGMEQAFEARYMHRLAEVADQATAALRALKRSRGLQSYDDLLLDLHTALRSPGGEALASRLRERYAAALIDEFQDTDPLQYEIFESIYADSAQPRYFVGDPKQAIYAFRGADIHAYLKARTEAQAGFTLQVNRRSVPLLVQAVNNLFGSQTAPFLMPEIEFRPVQACASAAVLHIEGMNAAPLQCRWLARESAESIGKGVATAQIASSTAEEIAALLASVQRGETYFLAEEERVPLQGGDIAVLVQTHHQAACIKQELAARGVASVTYGQDSVYDSEEALELAHVLAAVAEPAREGWVRAALATEMLGRDAAALNALTEEGLAWEAVLDRFAAWHRLAREQGFMRMWRALMSEEHVAARLLALPNGERRMTNMQHLADLLHQAECEEGLDLEGLMRRIFRAREMSVGDAEAQQLRLESDEHLVQVLTLHAAKGLEFPLVYCPFLWDGRLREELPLAFHDAQGDAALDFGSPQFEAHRLRALEAQLSEKLRLTYVALTRAQHCCVFAWGAIKDAEASALAWLLHGEGLAGADPLGALRERFAALNDADLLQGLRALEAQGGFAVCEGLASSSASLPKKGPVAPGLAARRFEGPLPRAWRISSFSGLIAAQEGETPDYDALPIAADRARSVDTPPATALMAMPGGVQTGTMIHQLFEAIDFRATTQVSALVREKLAEFDFDSAWAPALERMLSDVVRTPLDQSGLRLERIAPTQRLIEMEFLFPVEAANAAALREALLPLATNGSRLPEAIGSTILAPAHGYIKGYIDLVFEYRGRYYVADYKSNRLGLDFEDYAPARLAVAMSESWYDLQYLLYTVALHRYLRRRIPAYDYERHFGGVYYLFVRGMSPERGCDSGVYFTRPAQALIEALDRLFEMPAPQ